MNGRRAHVEVPANCANINFKMHDVCNKLPGDCTETLAPHVLLVEDETVIRALLAEELRASGCIVVEAATADEAWAYLLAGGHTDLVFSDITMPGSMNGAELVRRIRNDYPEIKTLLTSANPGPATANLGRFIMKPYRLCQAVALAMESLGHE
jgi:CheY-like chemotaxis protein